MGGYMSPDVSHNHWTYVEEKASMRNEPQNMVLAFHVLNHKLPSLSRSKRTWSFKEVLFNLVTPNKLTSWSQVLMIGLVTIWQLVKNIKIFWVDSEVLNQIQGFSKINPIITMFLDLVF